jgi:hypothetical protein
MELYRSILRKGGSTRIQGSSPRAADFMNGQKRLSLKLLKLYLESWRLTLQPWKLYLNHCGSAWRCRGTRGQLKNKSLMRCGGSPWRQEISWRFTLEQERQVLEL